MIDSGGNVKLRRKRGERQNENEEMELQFYMDGPYGSPEIDLDSDRYKLFLLISGGIGITPMQSICNQLVHEHEELNRPMKKIVFIWACADKFMTNSTFEKDREWAKGKAKSSFKTKLPIAFQAYRPEVNTLRRMSVDPSFFRREIKSEPIGLIRADTVYSITSNAKPEMDILHTEFYLTREDGDDFNEKDVRRELVPYVKFGRPNYLEILVTMRYYAIQAREQSNKTRSSIM